MQTERTTVRREPERGVYERARVNEILDAGFVCHVGFVHNGHPFVIPTSYWRMEDDLYVHGSSASRMLRDLANGIDLCVTVTFVDGLVLARSAFNHSINYRSVVVLGRGQLLATNEEKTKALHAFMEKLTPGRWNEVRGPSDQELKATSVFRVSLAEASAKVRVGPPIDDQADYSLDCWAGVLPMFTTRGSPVPDPQLRQGIATPEYVLNHSGPAF